MEITFNIDKAFRKFKEGTDYKINTIDGGILYIGGRNGCGKSTLLQILRSKMDSLHAVNKANADGLTHQQLEMSSMEPATVTGFDYDEAFFLDSIIDDPISLENSSTAWAIVAGGGLTVQHISKGEKSLMMIEKFRRSVRKVLENKYGSLDAWKASGKKGLIVLDEVDEGLDMNLQFRWNKIVNKIMIQELGCDVICVSHNPICILSETTAEKKIFDFTLRLEVSTEEFFAINAGQKVTITSIDFDAIDNNLNKD